MTIAVGDRLPDATFHLLTPDGPATRSTDEIFSGRKVVLFGVPGAFTPTCHGSHLPGFLEHRDEILRSGVDEIAVLATNDIHVMHAWAQETGGAGRILFLTDLGGAFVSATGLSLGQPPAGHAVKSARFSMIVEHGVVTALNVEESPRQATASGAARILEILGQQKAA